MGHIYRSIRIFLAAWLTPLLLFPLAITLTWALSGYLLSSTYFDSQVFDSFKVLDASSPVLDFMAVLLAILIPLFILFLETMKKSDYVYKVVLPEITGFRIIATSLITCALLVLVSPREAYLYPAVLFFVAVTLFVVVQAVDVVFRIEVYTEKIRRAIARWVREAFKELLKIRILSNEFHESLKKSDNKIEVTYFGFNQEGNLKILAGKSGYLERFYERRLKVAAWLFFLVHKDSKISINSNPGAYFKPDTAVVYLSDGGKLLWIWNLLFSRTFLIKPKSHRLEALDKVLDDFERRLNIAVESDDSKTVAGTLQLYRFATDELDVLVKDHMIEKDANYNFAATKKDVRDNIFSDNLSKMHGQIYDVIEKPLEKSIRLHKFDSLAAIITDLYSSWLASVDTKQYSRTARNDLLIMTSLGYFIHDNSWNKKPSPEQLRMLDYILARIREGTSMLAFKLRDSSDDPTPDSLEDGMYARIDSLRSALIYSYKAEKPKVYKGVADIFLELEDSRRNQVRNGVENVARILSSSVLVALAVMKNRNDSSSEYAKPLWKIVREWDDIYLLSVVRGIIDDNLTETWRIDTIDLPADGKMHSVPNYDLTIKELWVEAMFARQNISTDPSVYGDVQEFAKTMFFTNGANKESEIDLLRMIDKYPDSKDKEDFQELVRNFVALRISSESEAVRQASIDENKVDEYVENANSSFGENATILKLFKDSNYIDTTSDQEENFKQVGLNTVFDKEMFIDMEWHIGYSLQYQGEDIGRNIAGGVDSAVLGTLLSDYDSINVFDTFMSTIRDINSPMLIFINKAFDYEFRQKIASEIKEGSSYEDQRLKDVNQALPIQRVVLNGLPSGIYAVRQNEVGRIIHKKKSDKKYIDIEVDAYSENTELLESTLSAKPKWLVELGDELKQKEYLLSKVRLLVRYIFSYEPVQDRTVFFYPMAEELEDDAAEENSDADNENS